MLRAVSGGLPDVSARDGGVLDAPVEVGFVRRDGVQARTSLAEAAVMPFEATTPVRAFPSFKRQRHFPGLWWTATVGRHVGYESWLERDHLMLLDFDPDVVGIASQPFWLFWTDAGRSRSHAPDYFARRRDGTAVVVDVRPAGRIKPRDARAFETTAAACEQAGWGYRLVGVPDPVRTANVRWLAGYRHPRHALGDVVAALRAVFGEPTALMDGAEAVGDPIAVLPVLFHLMWCRHLVADLSLPVDAGTVVVTA